MNVLKPGVGMNVDVSLLDTKDLAVYTDPTKMQSATEFMMNIIPNSAVDAFATGNILQVLLFSVLFPVLLFDRGLTLVNFKI